MTINIFDIKEKSGDIFLIGRDDKDNSKVVISNKNDFHPHHGEFYIKKDSVDKLDDFENIIKTHMASTSKKSLFGDELVRVRYNIINWDRIKDLRELIQKHRDVIFEGDLWARTLYCLDSLPKLGYGLNGNWKICYLDIETTTSEGFPDSNNPLEQVLCSTFYDSYTKKYHFFYWGGEKLEDRDDIIMHQFETEEFMLEKIVRWLTKEQFDIMTGWNVHFDVGYMLQRYLKVCNKSIEGITGLCSIGDYYYNEKYKQFSIPGLCIFDLLNGYKRIVRNQMASFKLDHVAEEELGENKVEVDIKTLNKLTKEKLLSYNKKDVELCVRIDKKVNVINFFDGLRQFVGCPMDDVNYSRSIIDFMVLKKARELNIVLPTADNRIIPRKDRRHFEGAYVNAVQGSYDNVIAFDIAGLYPNIIKTFNLSIECCRKEGGDVHLPEVNIDMGKEGIIPSIVNDLMVLRKKYDDERDKWPAGTPEHEKNDILVESAKLVVDAIYGMCAFPGFRLFKSEIASTITYCGREIIKHTEKFIEDMGHLNVIIDTDSNIFPCDKRTTDDIVKYGYEVLDKVNKEYDRWVKERWGIEKSYLVNVFKKVYDRLIVGAKKRYCGHVVWAKGHLSDKLEIVGMEFVRSDYSRFARDFQYDLMKLLLDNKKDDVVMDFIKGKFKEMKTVSPSLIAIPTKIEKNLDQYSTNLPKVRGAKYSSRILNETFGKGDKPLLLFCSGESDIILFYNDDQSKKLLERVKIDWQKMIERNILMTSHMLIQSDRGDYMNTSLELISKNQTTLFGF